MSNIQLPSTLGSKKVLTFQRVDGTDTCDIQGIVDVNPYALVTGSITVNGGTVQLDCSDAGLLVFQASGTYGSVAIAFEASIDGSNWHSIPATRADRTATETASGTLSNTARAWLVDVNGFKLFRVRATAYTSGSMSIAIQLSQKDGVPLVGLAAGANTIGNVGIVGKTTGGATLAKLVSAASTNATSLKASAGTLYGCHACNNGAAFAYVKFYNKASAPTVGTDVPVAIFGLPPNSSIDFGIPEGIGGAFATGIAYAITGGMADTDTAAVAASQVALTLSYA